MIDYQVEKEITALLEKEFNESSEIKNIESAIEVNAELKNEFILQSFIKTTAQQKLKFYKVPDDLKEKLLRKINSGTIRSPYLKDKISTKIIIFGPVVTIILIIILLIINLFF